MKIPSFFITIILTTTLYSCFDSPDKISLGNNQNNGFAVVELFTSEGCSSCPAADNVVAKLLQEHNSDVYVLAYHVDYWNNLGWKDIFSSAVYTQIQREYAKAFELPSVYTPQVVVNGAEQFVGSDKSKLNVAIDKNLQEKPGAKLNINARLADNKFVVVNYSTDASNVKIKIALVQLNAVNKIQRGENSGATLHHVNIVRDLQTISSINNGKVMLNIPAGLAAKDFHIIAFTQNINDSKITSASEVKIQ